jgi:hypothetical protein
LLIDGWEVDVRLKKETIFFLAVLGVVALTCPSESLADMSFQEIFMKGKAAFVGRVVLIEEIVVDDNKTIAEAELKVMKLYYGVDGTENTRLKICYLRKATDPERIPVNFDLGRDYIIILNNAISASAIDFTSGTPEQPGERELDLAYLIADSFFDPYFYPRRRDAKSGHKNEPWRLFSVNKNSALYRVNAERAEIERWAKERALELEGEK